jgi:hypothetical protein
MKSDHKTLCLQINRRSTLALFTLFIATHSNEIGLAIGGSILLAISCSYLPHKAAHIEKQLNSLQIMIQEIRTELVDREMEMDNAH